MNKKISVLAILTATFLLSAGCGKNSENINVKPSVTGTSQSEKDTGTAVTTTGISTKKDTAKASDSVVYAGGEPEETVSSTSGNSIINSDTKQNNSLPDTKKPVEETKDQSYQAQTPAPAPADPEPWQKTEVEPTYIQDILIVNKTYALPSSYAPGSLTTETQQAFNKMKSDAEAEGLSLKNASDYRSYKDQERIYNKYVNDDGQEVADTYSARPGHSEHQTGLALDLNSISDSFAYTNEGIWVAQNCYKYGFIIRYPEGKENITGYKYEPWHIRYIGTEMAEKVYNSGLCLEEYLGITSKYAD